MFSMVGWKLGLVFCCGNIIVFKLVEFIFLFMLYVGDLICEVGFFLGVINIINGSG